MARFEDSFGRLQATQPVGQLSQEEAVVKRFNEIQAKRREQFDHPVNSRFRAIIGMMATTLAQRGIALSPHILMVGGDRDQNSYHNKKYTSWRNYSEEITDIQGWDLGLTSNHVVHQQRDRDLNRLFVKEDGFMASMDNPTVVAPANSNVINAEEISPHGMVLEHNGSFYVAYGDILRDTLPIRESRRHDDDTYYDLREGEIVRITSGSWEQIHVDSFEDNLARLLASKLAG